MIVTINSELESSHPDQQTNLIELKFESIHLLLMYHFADGLLCCVVSFEFQELIKWFTSS